MDHPGKRRGLVTELKFGADIQEDNHDAGVDLSSLVGERIEAAAVFCHGPGAEV